MLERLHFIMGVHCPPHCSIELKRSYWKGKALSRWSFVLCTMSLPRSSRKSSPSLLMAPIVLAATGTGKYYYQYDW